MAYRGPRVFKDGEALVFRPDEPLEFPQWIWLESGNIRRRVRPSWVEVTTIEARGAGRVFMLGICEDYETGRDETQL